MRDLCILLFLASSAVAEEADFKKMLQEYTARNLTPAARAQIEAAAAKIPPENRKAASAVFATQLTVPQHEARACPLLAKLGKDAVPVLLPHLKGGYNTLEAVTITLGLMGADGADAIPTLKELFKNPPSFPDDAPPQLKNSAEYRATRIAERRGLYALCLSGIGEDAATFLIETLKAPDAIDRALAARALNAHTHIKDPQTRCLPILVEMVEKDSDARVRVAVAISLASYGRVAKAALPALLKMYNSPDPSSYDAARDALREIDGKVPPPPLAKDPRLSDDEVAVVTRCRQAMDDISAFSRGRPYPQALAGDDKLEVTCGDLQDADDSAAAPKPLHGYVFRILKGQGPRAKGGERPFIKDGKMTDGCALLAYPIKKTPVSGHAIMLALDGIVYISDIGDDTKAAAAKITVYNPDEKWSVTKAGEPLAKRDLPRVPGEPAR